MVNHHSACFVGQNLEGLSTCHRRAVRCPRAFEHRQVSSLPLAWAGPCQTVCYRQESFDHLIIARRLARFVGLTVFVFLTILAGLVSILVAGLIRRLVAGLVSGFLAGLVSGLVAGLVSGLVRDLSPDLPSFFSEAGCLPSAELHQFSWDRCLFCRQDYCLRDSVL